MKEITKNEIVIFGENISIDFFYFSYYYQNYINNISVVFYLQTLLFSRISFILCQGFVSELLN